MSPFRKKGTPKYETDVVEKKCAITDSERMPKYFLGDSKEDAIRLYNDFKKFLNGIAYSYAKSTNLSRSDLFGEALIGLARANRDWEKDRSDNFKSYAIFKIKEAIDEFVRLNKSVIAVPSYIAKAGKNINRAKAICFRYQSSWEDVVIHKNIPTIMSDCDIKKINIIIGNLTAAAERAGVDYEKFIERVRYTPKDYDIDKQIITSEGNESSVEAALIVKKLKSLMDDDELAICERIMHGKSYSEIADDLSKDKSWVSNKLNGLRKKVLNDLSWS